MARESSTGAQVYRVGGHTLAVVGIFMALFAALLCERVSARSERWLLGPAILVGLTSVLYWRFFDDLRPYVWIQLVALLMIPAALVLFRRDRGGDRFLVIGFACYALAKGAEAYDHPIFGLTGGWISGHTLKHLLASLACVAIYAMLRQRAPRVPNGRVPS